MLTKNMVYFRGRNLSFTLGQSTQFCDKADYMAIPPFRSADSVPLVLQLQVTIQYHAIFLLSYFIHYIQQADNWTGKYSSIGLKMYFVWNSLHSNVVLCFGGLSCHTVSLLSYILWGTSTCSVVRTVQWSNFSDRVTPKCLQSIKNEVWQSWEHWRSMRYIWYHWFYYCIGTVNTWTGSSTLSLSRPLKENVGCF